MVPFYCLLYNGLWKNNIWENDYTKAKINFKKLTFTCLWTHHSFIPQLFDDLVNEDNN